MPENKRETLSVGLLAYGVVALLVVIAAWQFIFDQSGSIGTAPPKVQQGTLAVLPFANKTEEENLNDLGYIAADWIANVLRETRSEQVVLAEEVRKHIEKANLNGKSRAFADATQSNYFLLGSYEMEEDSLIMSMRLIGATSGMKINRFPELSSGVKDPMKLVSNAAKMIQQYFEVDSAQFQSKLLLDYDTYKEKIKMDQIENDS